MRFRTRPPDPGAGDVTDAELASIVMYLLEPEPEPEHEPGGDRGGDPSAEPPRELPGALGATLTRIRAARDGQDGVTPYVNRPRRGCPEEVLVTMVGAPADWVGAVVPGRHFERRIGRLEVDASSCSLRDHTLAWAASVSMRPWRRRPATLRMFGSASMNVTVLTLTPDRPHRVGTGAFVRAGWPSLTELRDRIVGVG